MRNVGILSERGMTLVEVLVVAGLTALIVGISVTPILQMKKLEKRVEFQSSLDTAHHLALLKARNGSFLKTSLDLANAEKEKCFGARGTGCLTFKSTAPQELATEHFSQTGGYSATSKITASVDCDAAKCTQVTINVATTTDPSSLNLGWQGRNLAATFSLPAAALASRQEIDFSECVGKVITGVDYNTLKAKCDGIGGTTTCQAAVPTGVSGNGGPMSTFGLSDASASSNCQVPVAKTCVDGLGVVGLINGQASCSTASAGCPDNWQPQADSICNGTSFMQTDLNNACNGHAPRLVTGTNPAVCSANSCSQAGVKWPNPATGPCGVSAATLSAAAGASVTVTNEVMGYVGSYTANCVDNTPAPSSFTMSSNSCSPIQCGGLGASVQWSGTGMKAGASGAGLDPTGPWACSGALSIVNSAPQAGGVLNSIQMDASAKATSVNSSATATAGGLTITCNDPGPANAPRTGVLNVSGVTCTPAAPACNWTMRVGFHGASPGFPDCATEEDQIAALYPGGCTNAINGTMFRCNVAGSASSADPIDIWTCSCGAPPPPPPTAGYCLYKCIDNYADLGVGGRLADGETSADSCLNRTNPPGKFMMQCDPYDGASCHLTTYNGMAQAVCNAGPPPPPPVSSFLFGACFVAGTEVTMANGEKKAIESIQVGELIKTYDEITHQVLNRPVSQVYHHEVKEVVLFTFHFEGGQVTSNDQHRYYLPYENKYFSAIEVYNRWLQGERIFILSEKQKPVEVTEIVPQAATVPLFNLHVEGKYDFGEMDGSVAPFGLSNHNYFANGVLVHNYKSDLDPYLEAVACARDVINDVTASACHAGNAPCCHCNGNQCLCYGTPADEAAFAACCATKTRHCEQ